MSKVTVPAFAAKPSIRFCPRLAQHESGIDYVQCNGSRTKIGRGGYTAPTMEDERKLLRQMEVDPFCGITTWENRELPAEQKAAESETRKLSAELDASKNELEAIREEMRQLKASKG